MRRDPARCARRHQSSLCIYSSLSLVAITATKHSFHDSDTLPWLLENRYYTASLQFKLLDSLDTYLHEVDNQEGCDIPAVVLLVNADRVKSL